MTAPQRISPHAKMVDVGAKADVPRRATAMGVLVLKRSTVEEILARTVEKGDVFTVARVAGIQAVKETPRLLPLCHPIPLTGVEIGLDAKGDRIEATCTVTATYRTGVEMEALVGVTAALLCAWDMVKPLEKDERGQYPTARMTDVRVVEKRKG
jgi:cyclic pyranopterin phosphate synthase